MSLVAQLKWARRPIRATVFTCYFDLITTVENAGCRKGCNMLQFLVMKPAKNRNLQQPARDGPNADARRRRKDIADKVKLHLEDAGISRPEFERMVGRSQSTIDHFFAGDFAAKLLARIEHVLGKAFGPSSGTAPEEWGAYTKESTAPIAGSYLTIRNDFKDATAICAYVTRIEWSTIEDAHIFDGQLVRKPKIDGHGLVFREERRVDSKYTHRGQVWIPGGQYLYFVSAYGDGRLRATIASVPDKGRMTGILLSLHNPRGAAFAPAAAPIAFLKRDQIAGEELGNFKPGQGPYNSYLEILRQASADVVFALPT